MDYLKLFQNHTEYEAFVSGGTMMKPNVSHCVQENEVHYNSLTDPYNGKEYVDLGLPSGTKWAKMNVGASSETDAGLYFAWGETQGYVDASTKAFSWSDYKYGSSSNLTKYNATDGKTVLDAEDDAAHVNMGGEWHMPTKEQCEELFNTEYVTGELVENYNNSGINGCLFTSVSNGNIMFIPDTGIFANGEFDSVGKNARIWSSSLGADESLGADDFNCGQTFFFGGLGGKINEYDRCIGQSVRGVVGQN